MELTIRQATLADAARLAELIGELGYPAAVDPVRQRLDAIHRADGYETLVACERALVVGFVGTRVGLCYEADGLNGQIVALAVAASHRRRGVGRRLMHEAESRLIERGVRELILTSGNHRAGAHAFYESLGYAFTGRRYKRRVSAAEAPPP